MPELQFLKTLIFPRVLLNLQNWVFFFLIKNISVSIIKKVKFIVSIKPN